MYMLSQIVRYHLQVGLRYASQKVCGCTRGREGTRIIKQKKINERLEIKSTYCNEFSLVALVNFERRKKRQE